MKTEVLRLQEYGDKYFALCLGKVKQDYELAWALGITDAELTSIMKRIRKVKVNGITYFKTRNGAENILNALKMLLVFKNS